MKLKATFGLVLAFALPSAFGSTSIGTAKFAGGAVVAEVAFIPAPKISDTNQVEITLTDARSHAPVAAEVSARFDMDMGGGKGMDLPPFTVQMTGPGVYVIKNLDLDMGGAWWIDLSVALQNRAAETQRINFQF